MTIVFATAAHADSVSVEDVVLDEGESTTIEVGLDNTGEYVALQMNLFLPEGLTLDRNGCSLSSRAGSGMTLSIGKKRDYYSIIISSDGNTTFTGTEGAIMQLTLKADGEFVGGEASLTGVRVVDTAGNRSFLDDCTFYIGKKEPYVVLSDNEDGGYTLTFVNDALRHQREETTYNLQTVEELEPEWWTSGACYSVTRVVFDESFASVKPAIMHSWIREMPITEVEGIEYLNTSEVADMGAMFYCSSSLTSLDLSHCDLSNVTDFVYTFFGCGSLRHLALPLEVGAMGDTTFENMSTEDDPCELEVPDGFDFGGIDTSGTFYWNGGWFKLKSKFPMGDVNHDMTVTVTDVMMTVNAVVSIPPAGFYPENADMNGDHDINVADVMMIVKIVVGN